MSDATAAITSPVLPRIFSTGVEHCGLEGMYELVEQFASAGIMPASSRLHGPSFDPPLYIKEKRDE